MKEKMISITDTNEFESIILTLKESLTRLEDDFGIEKKDMEKIDNTDTWTGEVQKKIYAKYNEISNCYNPIVESLETYIKFLENVVSNYKRFEENVNNNLENNFDELNVN